MQFMRVLCLYALNMRYRRRRMDARVPEAAVFLTAGRSVPARPSPFSQSSTFGSLGSEQLKASSSHVVDISRAVVLRGHTWKKLKTYMHTEG